MRGKVKFGPYLSSFFGLPNSEQDELLRAFYHFLIVVGIEMQGTN